MSFFDYFSSILIPFPPIVVVPLNLLKTSSFGFWHEDKTYEELYHDGSTEKEEEPVNSNNLHQFWAELDGKKARGALADHYYGIS